MEKGLFVVYERYLDQSAFESHLAAPHTQEFNRAVSPFVVGGRSSLTFLYPLNVLATTVDSRSELVDN